MSRVRIPSPAPDLVFALPVVMNILTFTQQFLIELELYYYDFDSTHPNPIKLGPA